MKKLASSAVLAVLPILLLSGCAAPTPVTSPQPTALSALARPDAAQRTALKAELAKVNPEFSDGKSLMISVTECRSNLSGTAEKDQIARVQAMFTGVKSVSEEDATRIIQIIKDNGFCQKKAASQLLPDAPQQQAG